MPRASSGDMNSRKRARIQTLNKLIAISCIFSIGGWTTAWGDDACDRTLRALHSWERVVWPALGLTAFALSTAIGRSWLHDGESSAERRDERNIDNYCTQGYPDLISACQAFYWLSFGHDCGFMTGQSGVICRGIRVALQNRDCSQISGDSMNVCRIMEFLSDHQDCSQLSGLDAKSSALCRGMADALAGRACANDAGGGVCRLLNQVHFRDYALSQRRR